jgi:predicted nuclease of predicted toxin-antitoxin system
MRVLLDMPVSASLVDVLQAHGHEGIHAHDIGWTVLQIVNC